MLSNRPWLNKRVVAREQKNTGKSIAIGEGATRISSVALSGLMLSASLKSEAFAAGKTITAVMHSDLRIIDPGFYTLTLRDGLKWHDGTLVIAEDCVASLKRWGKNDGMGQKLMDFTASLEATDAKTITPKLKEPYWISVGIDRQAIVICALHARCVRTPSILEEQKKIAADIQRACSTARRRQSSGISPSRSEERLLPIFRDNRLLKGLRALAFQPKSVRPRGEGSIPVPLPPPSIWALCL